MSNTMCKEKVSFPFVVSGCGSEPRGRHETCPAVSYTCPAVSFTGALIMQRVKILMALLAFVVSAHYSSAAAQQFGPADCTAPFQLGTDHWDDEHCERGVWHQPTPLPHDQPHTMLRYMDTTNGAVQVLVYPSAVGGLCYWLPEEGSQHYTPGDIGDLYFFAEPMHDWCYCEAGGIHVRSCPTAYGRLFQWDVQGDGAFDDTGVVFIDGSFVPLNFRMLFVPLNWTGSQAAFDQAATNQVNLFAQTTGLGGCLNTIEIVTLDVATANMNFSCAPGDCRIGSIRDFLHDRGGPSPYGFDVVVGLLPAFGSPCPPLGCSNSRDIVWLEESQSPILAHEIGHIYSLADEYCSEDAGGDSRCAGPSDFNFLGADLQCNPNWCPGCCCFTSCTSPAGNYFWCCDGNASAAGGAAVRCIMSAAGVTQQQDWCQRCLQRLNGQTEFRCDAIPSAPFRDLFAVALERDAGNNFQVTDIEVVHGRPMRIDMPGNQYRLLLEDAGGVLLDESFDLIAYDWAERSVFDLSARAPYSMAKATDPVRITVMDQGLTVLRSTAFGSPPIADAGPDQEVECEGGGRAIVHLDGRASFDADRDLLRYHWQAPGMSLDIPEGVNPTGSFPLGETVVTLTVNDGIASASDSVVVLVVDTLPPLIACPPHVTVVCGAPTDPDATGWATATDACDEDVEVPYSPEINDLETRPVCVADPVTKTITRTWTALDDCGNAASCQQTITVLKQVHEVDIKPGSCPNPLNGKSQGVLPVAVLGTASLDASTIDIASVRLSRADCVGGSVAPLEGPRGPHSVLSDVATPFAGEPCDCHGLLGDGVVDLSMKFDTVGVVSALELNRTGMNGSIGLAVTGTLADQCEFIARDCVRLTPSPRLGLIKGLAPGLPTDSSSPENAVR